MSTTIFYFTGTGNSLKIARDLSDATGGAGLVRITPDTIPFAIDHSGDVVGIVFPVYVAGLPLIVEAFVRNLALPPDAYVFAVANYGEGAGGSLVQMDDMLKERGIVLSGAFGIKMPDNTQILFPPSPVEEQEEDFRQEAASIATIAGIVRGRAIARTEVESRRAALGTSWRRKPFNPREMAKKFRVDEKCTGCGQCAAICPVESISMEEGKPVWLDRCEQCGACMQWCPEEAIQFENRTTGYGRYHNPAITVRDMLR